MFEKVLVAVDFSPFTDRLLGCADEFAAVGLREIILLHVLQHPKELAGAASEEVKEAQAKLARMAEEIQHPGLSVRTLVEAGNPAQVIVNAARRENVSFIYTGAHGRGLVDRLTLGSVSDAVLKLADRPVMILQCRTVRQNDSYTCETACDTLLRHALVASDFSTYFESLKPVLEEFAGSFRVPMTLLHVQPGGKAYRFSASLSLKNRAKQNLNRLQELRNCLADYCPRFDMQVIAGDPAVRIPEMAEELDASLIVMGAFGKGGVLGEMLGSVTQKVVRHSLRPVLVLKPRA